MVVDRYILTILDDTMVANNSYLLQCYHDIQTMNKQPRGEREIKEIDKS